MQLRYVIVYVEDVPKATQFYENAFGFAVRFVHESNMYAEMDSGQTLLAFAHNDMLKMNTGLEAQGGVKTGFELALTTDDVHAALHKAVNAGAKELAAPAEKPWGQTVAYVQDPFGAIIEICTPMG
ncbi:MAG: VOC family protein [Desulfovibrio sp.]|nr:MAG: VOC family protein [Desulfovibrio sp.]